MIVLLLSLTISYILLFLLSIKLRDNSIADIFWGLWFILIAWVSYGQSIEATSQTLVTLLVTAWGLRLVLNIATKKFFHSGEDARYARWRLTWKYFYLRSFVQVFVFQGILMFFVATPIWILNFESGFGEHTFLTMIGWLIALFGLIYETIADSELRQFVRTKEEGQILTQGLRKFHRYPQYFGESVFWFGISLIAVQISFWAFAGWGLITFLLLFVSGVPLLEARYKGQRNYTMYKKKTPVFFPDYRKIWEK